LFQWASQPQSIYYTCYVFSFTSDNMATTWIVTARPAANVSLLVTLTKNISPEIINISTLLCHNRRFYDQHLIKLSMPCKQQHRTARKYYFWKKNER
jgi:hypothetical protein